LLRLQGKPAHWHATLKDPAEFATNYGSDPSLEGSGAAYLRSLKHTHLATPEPPLQEPVIAPEGKAAGSPADRRRSERFKCQGSARFRTEEDVVHTYGTLTDVSLHGCYVEMMATSPVGTKVNMLLEVNGIRAAVRGIVRVSYPFLGMGIEFTGLDVPTQQALREMTVSLLPHISAVGPSKPAANALAEPLLIPIITDPAAALSAIANFFQDESSLTRQEFLRLIQKSQSSR
jgi:PilZ domain